MSDFYIVPMMMGMVFFTLMLVLVCLCRRKRANGSFFRVAQPAVLTPATRPQAAGYMHPSQTQPAGYPYPTQTQPAGYPYPAQTQPAGYPYPAQTQPAGYSHPSQTAQLSPYPPFQTADQAGPRTHPPPEQQSREHYSGYSPHRPPSQAAPQGTDDAPPSYESVVAASAGQKQQPFNPTFQ